LISALTFVAPVHTILQCGAHPVLIDADDNWQLDAGAVAEFLAAECVTRAGETFNRRTGRRVRAIVAIHLLGLACAIDRLLEIARRHRLTLLEDAAQAIGVRYRGRHVGTFGDFGVLSFNGNKLITAGGGGMLLSANRRHVTRARRLANQGRDGANAPTREPIAFNYQLSGLQAALGLAQIERADALLASKRRIAGRYADAIGKLPGVSPMPVPAHTLPSFWLYTLRVPSARRGEIIRSLRKRGVGAAPLWPPVHRHNRELLAHRVSNAERLYASSISLPSSPSLPADEQRLCIDALRAALRSGARSRGRTLAAPASGGS
jgi:dTDP-4-amino-4,6-dideoxygalactose transaminase